VCFEAGAVTASAGNINPKGEGRRKNMIGALDYSLMRCYAAAVIISTLYFFLSISRDDDDDDFAFSRALYDTT
jgi:hypothetical protein